MNELLFGVGTIAVLGAAFWFNFLRKPTQKAPSQPPPSPTRPSSANRTRGGFDTASKDAQNEPVVSPQKQRDELLGRTHRLRIERDLKNGPIRLGSGILMTSLTWEEACPIVEGAQDAYVSDHMRDQHGAFYRVILTTGQPVVIWHHPHSEWIEVYSPPRRANYASVTPEEFIRYGFSAKKSRWSYGEGPNGAREVRSVLKLLDPSIQSRERL
jgi:hypothetical protein